VLALDAAAAAAPPPPPPLAADCDDALPLLLLPPPPDEEVAAVGSVCVHSFGMLRPSSAARRITALGGQFASLRACAGTRRSQVSSSFASWYSSAVKLKRGG
jgi:hypothetical protein